jgi:hypothetical protein
VEKIATRIPGLGEPPTGKGPAAPQMPNPRRSAEGRGASVTLSQRYNQIADNLTRHIPAPKVKPAKDQQTWRTLRMDQRLELKERLFKPGLDLLPGSVLTISRVTSRGIELTTDPTLGKIQKVRWTDAEWKGMFKKLKKERTSGKSRSKEC